MASIDKIAIAWTIAIVVVGTGIAATGTSFESGSVSVPSLTLPTTGDDKIAAAKATIAEEQRQRMESGSESVEETMMEETMMEETMMEETMEETMMEETMEETMMEETMEETTDETMMEETMESQTHLISIPEDSGLPECKDNDMCYDPSTIDINKGDTIVWSNDDKLVPHTVTAGTLTGDFGFDYPNGFNSQFMVGGATYEYTFDVAGEYPYFCQLHPWMVGTVQVN